MAWSNGHGVRVLALVWSNGHGVRALAGSGVGRAGRGLRCDGDGGRAGERRGADLYLKEHNDGAVGSVFPLFPETQGALLLYFLHGNPRQAF